MSTLQAKEWKRLAYKWLAAAQNFKRSTPLILQLVDNPETTDEQLLEGVAMRRAVYQRLRDSRENLLQAERQLPASDTTHLWLKVKQHKLH